MIKRVQANKIEYLYSDLTIKIGAKVLNTIVCKMHGHMVSDERSITEIKYLIWYGVKDHQVTVSN